MYKILVVDDEILVRESLYEKILGLGYKEVLTASDGIEAYSAIVREKPDIVLADIRMPGLDGIELFSKIKELFQDIIFIFISGYDLFEYAKKAIQLGAFSYLLKPLNDKELEFVILDACRKIKLKREKYNQLCDINIKVNQALKFMSKQFLYELSNGQIESEDYIAGKVSELNINLDKSDFCIVIVSIDDYYTTTEKLTTLDRDYIKFSIDNISSEIFNNRNINSFGFNLDDGHGYLLNIDNSLLTYKIDSVCSEIKDSLANFMSIYVSIGIGSIVKHLKELKKSYKSAQDSLTQRLVKGKHQIFSHADLSKEKKETVIISFETEQKLLTCFEKTDSNISEKIIYDLYKPFLSSTTIDSEVLSNLNLQLILLIFKILHRFELEPEQILGDEFMLYRQVNICTSIDSMIKWFQEKLLICYKAITASREIGNRKIINKARKFIQENIEKDISLNMVSEYVHLSTSHFSRIFHTEIGEPFTNYVINYRINKAKELLKKGDYKTDVISRLVGFSDVKHFYKTFKKVTGLTPSEYRKL